MNLRYAALFLVLLCPYFSLAVKPKYDCMTNGRTLVPGTVEKTDTSYRIADTTYPDFHITGVLLPDGTLAISTYRQLSNGDNSNLPVTQSVKDILQYFGDRAKRVEVRLNKLSNIDDINFSQESELDRFNRAWTEAFQDSRRSRTRPSRGPVPPNGTVTQRAAAATEIGQAILSSRPDLSVVQVKSSLGNEGRFVSLELSYSPR